MPAGADLITPAASMPGVNGSGSFSWYPPLVCSRSANDTPAAATSMITPPSAVGSSASAHRTSSGPVNPSIRCANIRLSFRSLPQAVPELSRPGPTTTMDHSCCNDNDGPSEWLPEGGTGQASPAGIQAAHDRPELAAGQDYILLAQ